MAAEKYGLDVLEYDLQDNAANATRFLVLGRQCSPPTGNDRTSIMVSVTDKVGALYSALSAFRRYRINMTKIESRPSKRKAWEYFFSSISTATRATAKSKTPCAIWVNTATW